MKHETIFRRGCGLRVSCEVKLHILNFQNKFRYCTYVSVCGKGKRTFRTPMTEYERATEEELLIAKNNFWKLIKPTSEA